MAVSIEASLATMDIHAIREELAHLIAAALRSLRKRLDQSRGISVLSGISIQNNDALAHDDLALTASSDRRHCATPVLPARQWRSSRYAPGQRRKHGVFRHQSGPSHPALSHRQSR